MGWKLQEKLIFFQKASVASKMTNLWWFLGTVQVIKPKITPKITNESYQFGAEIQMDEFSRCDYKIEMINLGGKIQMIQGWPKYRLEIFEQFELLMLVTF